MDKDRIIIAGIIKGDEVILKKFYRDNFRYIQGYITQNYGNPEDVEDIFQDALVFLYQKLSSGSVEITSSIRTYFYGVCKNMWRNRLRKKKKLIINDVESLQELQMDYTTVDESKNEDQEHLYRKYFLKLSITNKKILQLFFEGKSMKEIATITGYSEGYTRKKKFEAKRQLAAMIEEDPLYRKLQPSHKREYACE